MTNGEWTSLWQACGRMVKEYCFLVFARNEELFDSEDDRILTDLEISNENIQGEIDKIRIELDGRLDKITAQSPLTMKVLMQLLDSVVIFQNIEKKHRNGCPCIACKVTLEMGEACKDVIKILANAEITTE